MFRDAVRLLALLPELLSLSILLRHLCLLPWSESGHQDSCAFCGCFFCQSHMAIEPNTIITMFCVLLVIVDAFIRKSSETGISSLTDSSRHCNRPQKDIGSHLGLSLSLSLPPSPLYKSK